MTNKDCVCVQCWLNLKSWRRPSNAASLPNYNISEWTASTGYTLWNMTGRFVSATNNFVSDDKKPQKMGRIHRSAMYIQKVTDSLAAQHHPGKELAAQHASQNLVLLEVWNWIIELNAGNKTDALDVLNVWIDGSFLVNRNLFFITLCGWWNIHLVP